VRQAEPVPDLSGAILARIKPRVNPHDPVLGWLRSGDLRGCVVVILSAALPYPTRWPRLTWRPGPAFGGVLSKAADRARLKLPMAVLLVGR
jgi:hypothetical protein